MPQILNSSSTPVSLSSTANTSTTSNTVTTTTAQSTTVTSCTVTAAQQPKVTSKDAHVIQTILKDMGVMEYEPAVVYQLLEFTYRYVSSVLEDAQVFSHYAKKKNIDAEDVRLAIQMQVDKMFTSPPPRDLLLEIARHKNSQSLPPIRSHSGPRLPPDRYSLIVCNYKLKSGAKIKSQQTQQQTHIQLPFRSGTSLLSGLNNRQPLITLQARPSQPTVVGNRIAVTTSDKVSSDTNTEESNGGVKRKLEDDNK
ncbi:transcription initiation factor TFII-D component-like protein [Dinothrombium tinctorium]|uniref:Transcription initiation factor TFII-D component-like protein n=1 Tax=Dinothrombium tinctorium TaxID=1965070 RepID=A0A3S3PUL1_9ACAR|nr:transcription initiation factor TFII-D component-like protein [Dinothrombium tinctorium]